MRQNYVVRSANWDDGAASDVGAATLGMGNTGTVGPVSSANSVIGTVASGGANLVASHSATTGIMVVGRRDSNMVSLFKYSTIETWRHLHFRNSADAGISADAFDYDNDALVNLIEYAFGLDPKLSSAGQLPQGQINSGDFVISFIEPTGVAEITYGAEWNTTLTGTWFPVGDAGTPPQHTFSVPIGTEAKLFLRLKVTRP